MKRNKVLIGLVIIGIMIISAVFIVKPHNVDYVKPDTYPQYSEILINSNIDIYDLSAIELSKHDLISYLYTMLEAHLNVSNKPITLKGIHLDFINNSIDTYLSLNLGPVPIGLNFKMVPLIIDNEIIIDFKDMRLGRVPISSSIIFPPNFLREDNLYAIKPQDSIYKNIYPYDLILEKESLSVIFEVDIYGLIEDTDSLKNKNTLTSMIKDLDKNQESRYFANTIVKIMIINNLDGKVPTDLIEKAKRDFNNLDIETKMTFMYNILRYQMEDGFSIIKDIFTKR